MEATRSTQGARGQGSVEYIGTVLVVATVMLVAAVAVLGLIPDASGGGSADRSPPVPRVAVDVPSLVGPASGQGRPWFGRLARGAVEVVRAAAGGQVAMVDGFVHSALDDLRALGRDPLAFIVGSGGGESAAALVGPGARLQAPLALLRRYVTRVRSLGLRRGYLQLMFDTGALAEDVLIGRGRRLLARRLADALRRRRTR